MSEPEWWRGAVCYELYVRAFADGDGDGVGDLPGATARLGHLRDLGVDAVWLTPFYPSPMADGGYDIEDHTAVAPDLGTLEDLDRFVAQAHAYGLRVLIDLVPNHTADTHPWFRAALAAGPGGTERERYVFRDGRGPDGGLPPNDWQSAFGGPAWTRTTGADGRPGQWYLHLHAPEQPDLNWRDPRVPAEFERVLRFWLERGIDGFRIDVAHALFKDARLADAGPGQHLDIDRNHLMPYYDREELHPLYRAWRALVDQYPGDRLLVAEAAVFDPERLARYVRRDEMHQAFNFAFLEARWGEPELRRVIDDSLDAMAPVGAPVTWVLASHDAVRTATRFGGGPRGLARARAAALLMLALPGAAYLYQGEELGLDQVEVADDEIRDPVWERSGHTERGRDGCRVPLPWSGSRPPYGFSPAGPDVPTWFTQPAHWGPLTAGAQSADARSTLALYREALRIRREHPASGEGPLPWADSPAGVLTFTRGDSLTCQANLGDRPVPLADGTVLLSSGPLADGALPPDTAVWLERPRH
ncbi:glycoside hydrolase family 13 protein [Actinacidiphila yeochonensis]|uniref:glycoside hydrolase family 13 protein n=1 Tax=Actinacidiphila yeochonensis TaxID=89050 RepID=UPI000568E6A5|nr:glycoside hydrolase family 13 protein [Actinacidiphila yeochonensis]